MEADIKFDPKKAFIYFNALVLQTDYINKISRHAYCGWNCPKSKDCSYCEQYKKRQLDYWIREAENTKADERTEK